MPKKYNLLGQTFGKLTVLEKTRLGKQVAWKCKCECGNEKIVITHNLVAGIIVSCGCFRKENASKNFIKDLTGQQFGELTVLGPTEQRKNGAIVWECLCSCGKKTYVQTGNLSNGHTRSCGHLHKTRPELHTWMLNKRFGRLTVIEFLGTSNNQNFWKCKCDCGNYTISSSARLNNGNKLSCGCLKSKGEQKIIELLDQHNIPYEYQKTFSNCLNPDTNRPLIFDFYIDNKYIIEYDGQQHFEYNDRGWSNLENLTQTKLRDKIKNEWCESQGIPIIRIPYTHFKNLNISDLILEETKWLLEMKPKNN